MALYEYRCEQCGDVFEVIQKFADEPLTMHDKCGGRVERLISVAALQFKGSGWYVTDYAKSKSPAPGSPSGNGSSSSDGSGAGSADKSASPTSATGESKPATSSSSSDKKSE